MATGWRRRRWSVGVGRRLLVAPTIGVIIADYWVTKRRAVDTPELFKVPPRGLGRGPAEWASRDDTYWYQSGVHARAVASVLVGAAPNLISLWSGLAAMLTKTGQMRLNLYVVNSEYSSLLGAAIAATVYLLTFAVAPTAGGLKTVHRGAGSRRRNPRANHSGEGDTRAQTPGEIHSTETGE